MKVKIQYLTDLIGLLITLLIITGFELIISGMIVIIKLSNLTFSAALASFGIGEISIGIAFHSIKLSKDLIKKGIIKKLSSFIVVNNYNTKLIENLINHKENWYPQDLLDKKLNQPHSQKHHLTSTELKQIKGLQIPKEDFFCEYAVHVLDISYLLYEEFVEKIINYIISGKKLNQHKYICQHWALSRGRPNPDETHNYYNALDNAKEVTDEMKELIVAQLEKHMLYEEIYIPR